MHRFIALAVAIGLSASPGLSQTSAQSGKGSKASHKVAANHPNTGGKHRRSAAHGSGTGTGTASAQPRPGTGMGEGTTNSGMTEATTPH